VHVRLVAPLSLLLTVSAFATAQAPGTQPIRRVPDGGTRGVMESIFIPPKPGAPFTLVLDTEWSRPMANGGTFTMVNERRIARDSKGRIYEERWLLVPRGGKQKSEMNVRQIADPELHILYNCWTAIKECRVLNYSDTTSGNYDPPIGASGPLPDGSGFSTHEDLGVSTTVGIDTHGYRDTLTINQGVMGNDRPMVSTRESWYSPQLSINLLSIVDSPQSGRQVFTVKELSTSEPELGLFEIPEGYKVVDHRNEKE
jgi:hypothetical protein